MSQTLYQAAPRNLGELLERVDKAWTTLARTVDTLTEEQLHQADGGTWTLKDHLAHVTAWDERVVGVLNGRPSHEAMGIDASVREERGMEGVNEAVYQARKDRPTSQVLEEFHGAHEKVVEALKKLDDEILRRSYNSLGVENLGELGDKVTVLKWLSGSYEHYLEHEEMIQSVVGPS